MELISVSDAKYAGGHSVHLVFSNGASGEVDLSDLEWKGLLAPLQDINYFKNFQLDGWPTLCWPNGADLAPEFLYYKVTGQWPDEIRDMQDNEQ